MPDRPARHLSAAVEVDSVARWQELKGTYPQASFTRDRGLFYGSLREDDETACAPDLTRLIDKLLAREEGP